MHRQAVDFGGLGPCEAEERRLGPQARQGWQEGQALLSAVIRKL